MNYLGLSAARLLTTKVPIDRNFSKKKKKKPIDRSFTPKNKFVEIIKSVVQKHVCFTLSEPNNSTLRILRPKK